LLPLLVAGADFANLADFTDFAGFTFVALLVCTVDLPKVPVPLLNAVLLKLAFWKLLPLPAKNAVVFLVAVVLGAVVLGAIVLLIFCLVVLPVEAVVRVAFAVGLENREFFTVFLLVVVLVRVVRFCVFAMCYFLAILRA